MFSLSLAGWIAGSIASSVGLILVNKVLMQDPYMFRFVLTLTAAHFAVTSLGMEVMALLRFFTRSRMPLREMLLMAAMCIGSVAFMNFSLQYNSVGFYQVTKLLCIPCMVLIDSTVYGKHYSLRLKVTLALVLLGVGIATVTDLTVSALGMLVGALAVVFTTQFQIWQAAKQKQHAMDPMQINHSQSPPAALICALLALMFECQGTDPRTNVLLHTFQPNEMALIGLSCVLALSVNLCTYGLIGKTGPVTFQVVGHAKTCLILLGGFVMFPLPPPELLLKNIAGITLALLGVIIYGEVKLKSDRQPRGADFYDTCCPNFVARALDQADKAATMPAAAGGYAPVMQSMPSPVILPSVSHSGSKAGGGGEVMYRAAVGSPRVDVVGSPRAMGNITSALAADEDLEGGKRSD